MGLQAFADLHKRHPESEYWIFGDGPQRATLEKMVDDLNLRSAVTFMGRVPREEMLQRLGECDLLLHPSLHDSGAYVCLEAMASRRPVVCLDLGGPALLVSDETGIKIPAVNPEQVVEDITKSLEILYSDEEKRTRMGIKGNERVREHFIWELKATQILDLYEKILEEYAER
jgi:glycosyltransferase involved in cell wall biosynthesis